MRSQWKSDGLELRIIAADRVKPITYRFCAVLEERVSRFQAIRVMRHADMGKTLIVGDDVMSAACDVEYDRAMLELLPAGRDIRVLIMGGGDGSLAAELCRQEQVRGVTICEIDAEVLEICKRHFPQDLNGNAWKQEVQVGDAFQYLREHGEGFDVVFDDMTVEPTGVDEGYRLKIAQAFCGKSIISQTGELGSCVAAKSIEFLQRQVADIQRIARFIPSFGTVWTFTKYTLL